MEFCFKLTNGVPDWKQHPISTSCSCGLSFLFSFCGIFCSLVLSLMLLRCCSLKKTWMCEGKWCTVNIQNRMVACFPKPQLFFWAECQVETNGSNDSALSMWNAFVIHLKKTWIDWSQLTQKHTSWLANNRKSWESAIAIPKHFFEGRGTRRIKETCVQTALTQLSDSFIIMSENFWVANVTTEMTIKVKVQLWGQIDHVLKQSGSNPQLLNNSTNEIHCVCRCRSRFHWCAKHSDIAYESIDDKRGSQMQEDATDANMCNIRLPDL